ncbi:MAG: DUF732 domain-containing protein [Actinobacteria bacterium]|nr:DUF732 domain-containing protein [Actinomycetota bacterium]
MRVRRMLGAAAAAGLTAGALSLAAPAHADVDTDFARQLHTFGIYGQKDYNAWLAKIACERLFRGVDADAVDSARFISRNLPKDSTETQAWQFLATGVSTYCPEKFAVVENAAQQRG